MDTEITKIANAAKTAKRPRHSKSRAVGQMTSKPAADASIIKVVVTSGNKKQAEVGSLFWHDASEVAPQVAHTIELMPGTLRQRVDGFGSAITEGASYVLHRMPASKRKALLHELFDPSQQHLSVNRTTIGPSDYSTMEHTTYDDSDTPDPDMKKFSIATDRKWVIPTVKAALELNPKMFLFSSPWTPPAWMKSNKSLTGGNIQPQFLRAYALYFAKFIQAYAKSGINIDAVTLQNEVDTDQGGNMPQSLMSQEIEVGFVRDHLGPLLNKLGLKTKIWFLDHNPNLWGRALASLDDPNFRKYIAGVAWHTYGGNNFRIAQVRETYPNITAHWTEGGSDVTSSTYLTDHASWGQSITSNLRYGCQTITTWNVALDEKGYPKRGPFPCGGLVTVDSKTHAVSYSGLYHALGHFSRHVQPGAYLFESLSDELVGNEGVSHVAFVNPDGEKVVVLSNVKAAQKVSLRLQGKSVDVVLEGDSVTTLVWKD